MNKHTPGPWEWNGQVKASKVLIHSDNAPIIEGSAYENMWLASGSDETDAANLRLIAESPALLAFAKWAMVQLCGDSGTRESHWEQFKEFRDGQSAISKVEGRAKAANPKTPPPHPA